MKNRRSVFLTFLYLLITSFVSDAGATLNGHNDHDVRNSCTRCRQAVNNYMLDVNFQEDFEDTIDHITYLHQEDPGDRSYFYDFYDFSVENIVYSTINYPSKYKFGVYNNVQSISIVRNFPYHIGVFKNFTTGLQQETNTVWLQFEVGDGEIIHFSTGFPGRRFFY